MPPRFDPEHLKLELSVGDLVDASMSRHLGFANRGGIERRWLGQAIHSRYQERAMAEDPSYQREVALKVTFTHRGWEISVQGRIDGLRRSSDGAAVVEEIKSIRSGGPPSGPLREIYAKQALLYAWMLRRGGEEQVTTELVWIEIGSEHIEREALEFRFAAVDTSVRKRLNALLREFESGRAAAAARSAAAERLAFPHSTLRPGQESIVAAVETALQRREHLLIQAPTGIGKTAAALTPVVRHALSEDKRVFVLTAKTLQQDMAIRVLRKLNFEGAFQAMQMRAKAKMCANDQVLCHEEYCVYARDYYSKLQSTGVVHRLRETWSTLLPDHIFGLAEATEVCPFEVSLDVAREGQVVVCDYNYAFDPYVSMSDFHEDGSLPDTILVIDEIHNLVDRGRGYYSPSLEAAAARRAERLMAQGSEPVHREAMRLCRDLAHLIERTVDSALSELAGDVHAAEAILPEEELWSLRLRFDEAFVDYLEYRRETESFSAEDPFVDLYFAVVRFLDGLHVSLEGGEAFSRCVERGGDNLRLRIICKDPSRHLGRVINDAYSVIGLSATLSPIEFYRDLLGFDRERFASLVVPSPFPVENRSVVVDASVSTLYRKRPENYPRIAHRLAGFADAVPGNCLALFPSYRFLSEVADRLAVQRKRVLVQTATGTDREREQILDSLRSATAGDVLLLAVAGGVFAEGVDYPGDMLKAVAVIGPCLPALSLEQELLRRYYDDRFERGFEYAFVVPGMTRVVQAAGRLIRSAADSGVIALFDERFLAAPYRLHLPEDWVPESDFSRLAGEPARIARTFFGSA